ncbi:hypothetical protein CTAYLR_009123 [Chrysophaeum taylorii]|uniref:Uncharacterized protein n=1 Tax=Chrysophaeum taylorii TaxID=2483200 RepID=A0AAD7UK49_9STRA|nr:hypothetical protein CTAYLR_009123 [Chrysophaeum taylorii]
METPEVEMQVHETRAARARMSDARSASLVSAHLSLCGQLRRLKPWTRYSLMAFVCVIALMASWHWQLLLATLFLLAPTLGQLLRWWRRHPDYCPLDHVLSSYAHGIFVLGVVSMGTASAVGLAAVVAVSPLLRLFWSHRATWRLGWILCAIIFFTVFCFVEELWLLSTLRRFKRRRQHRVGGEGSARAQRAYVLYASASAVGYATAQCIVLTVIVTAIMEGHTVFEVSDERDNDEAITAHETLALAGLVLFFAWFWLPLRLAASHINVLELARHPELAEDSSACLPLPRDFRHLQPVDRIDFYLKPRFTHHIDIIKWSWGLRTVHVSQFAAWGVILAIPAKTMGVVSWLVMTFIFWCVILAVATWRARALEKNLEPSAGTALASSANLTALYGFSLLDDTDADTSDDFEELDEDEEPTTSEINGRREPASPPEEPYSIGALI